MATRSAPAPLPPGDASAPAPPGALTREPTPAAASRRACSAEAAKRWPRRWTNPRQKALRATVAVTGRLDRTALHMPMPTFVVGRMIDLDVRLTFRR